MVRDILSDICLRKRQDIGELERGLSLSEVRRRAESSDFVVRPFVGSLRERYLRDGKALIAEIKRSSPSRGLIRSDFVVGDLASAYCAGGATCLSVLTDGAYFGGDYSYIAEARGVVDLPILQKDFMLSLWQIYHARVIGADCVLLILSILDDVEVEDLGCLAVGLGMDVLLEVHDIGELERAMGFGFGFIGVNNRDLRTLGIDLGIGESLLAMAVSGGGGRFIISESGLYVSGDLERMLGVGAMGFLVGESLMREDDVEGATRRLLDF